MARFPDGWVFIPRVSAPELQDGNLVSTVSVDERELVMCRNCERRWTSLCRMYVGNQETDDEWFCADGERRDECGEAGERLEGDASASE